jgi:CSLREA domain-containing protein
MNHMRIPLALAAAAALVSLTPASAAAQAVFVVNSTADGGDAAVGNGVCATSGGACTLRAAVQEANAIAGADAIEFAVGSGLQTITLSSSLPAITAPVSIDGWTQPGYAGSPLIDINANGKGGLVVTGGGTTLRGLVVRNASGNGVELTNGGGNVLEGNYVGMAPNGTTPSANTGHGVVVTNSSNNRIGGTTVAQRNLISKNTAKGGGGGIVLNGGGSNVIQGNFIGTDITGMVEHPNEARGIAIIGSSNNLIGGPTPGAGNLIAGNRATGVRMLGGSNNNVVQRNFIGVNKTVTGVIPNDRGVQIRDGNANQVLDNIIIGNTYDGVLLWGATNTLVRGNVIAYNGYGPIGDAQEAGYFGIWVSSGTGNQILSNQIYGNYHLGINLNNEVVTANDFGDADGGANNSQNFPTLASPVRGSSSTTVAGSLDSTPNGTFKVQVFANPSCDSTGMGEGQYLVAETTVSTNAGGSGSFSVVIPALLPAGWAATATATDAAGNTSEFSPCAVVR